MNMEKSAERFEEIIGYRFKDQTLLQTALTHSSFSKEWAQSHKGEKPATNYERLEFLGDAVLELCCSNMLYRRYDWPEGKLTKTRAKIVCENSLSYVAKKHGFGQFLIMGKGEEKTGGRERNSILCDMVESVIGAVYLDGGYDRAKELIDRIVFSHLEEIQGSDYKTALQELLQGQGKPTPRYEVVAEEGPSNERVFTMDLFIEDQKAATAKGRSKKEAAQAAAKIAMTKLSASNVPQPE